MSSIELKHEFHSYQINVFHPKDHPIGILTPSIIAPGLPDCVLCQYSSCHHFNHNASHQHMRITSILPPPPPSPEQNTIRNKNALNFLRYIPPSKVFGFLKGKKDHTLMYLISRIHKKRDLKNHPAENLGKDESP